MKKLKLLPSILMLVLCVGVLAVGVFAITPTTNTISGQITINPSNAPVKIELLKDGTLIRTYDQVRTGITWDVNEFAKDGNTNLLFDTEGKNQVKEVPKIKFTLRVTNLSETEALGMFFENPESKIVANAEGVYPLATADNVLGDHVLKDKTDGTSPVANVYISKYTPLGSVTTVDGEKVYDTMDMNIVLSMADFYSTEKTADLNYKLIIEKYEATENYATSTDALIKIPFKSSTLTGKAFATDAPTEMSYSTLSNKQSVVYLSVPNTITKINWNYEYDNGYFSALEGISLPSTLTSYDGGVFVSTKLKSVDLSSCTKLKSMNAYTEYGFSGPIEYAELPSEIISAKYGWINSTVIYDLNVSSIEVLLRSYEDSIDSTKKNIFINGNLLTEVNYSDVLKNVGAFQGNQCITNVNFNGAETKIAQNSFHNWGALQTIDIPSTVEEIDGNVFAYSALKSISIPNVSVIGDYAFENCSLNYLKISKNIKKVSESSFGGMNNNNLELHYEGTLEDWFNVEFNYDYSHLPSCKLLYINGSLLTDLVVPNHITEVGHDRFAGCGSIESVTFHSGITEINERAFSGCKSLKDVSINGCSGLTIGTSVFNLCNSELKIKVAKGTTLTSAYTLPTNLKTGYTGTWNIPAIATTHEKDTIHTCTYTANTYAVTFNPRGGTFTSTDGFTESGTILKKDVVFDTAIGTLPTGLTKSGYKFVGWSTVYFSTVSDVNVTESTILTSIGATYFAVWEAEEES